MARRSFKQSVAAVSIAGLLVTGGVTIGSVSTAPPAQAAPCFVVQSAKNLYGSCDTHFILSYQCVGRQGSWAKRFTGPTNFVVKKPCKVAYNLKIKRSSVGA